MKMNNNGYLSIKNNAVTELKGHLFRTYSYIISKDYNQQGIFYGQDRIAKDLGVCIRTVQRHIKELKELGYLSVKRRGFNSTNLYMCLKYIVVKNKEKTNELKENFTKKFYNNKKPNYFLEHCPSRDRSGNSNYMTYEDIENKLLGWT